MSRMKTQALIIGSGIAGCTAALVLADHGIQVTLVNSGKDLNSGNTPLAQGGIVYRGENDDPKKLEKDILVAGWRENYVRNVRYLCKKGPDVVKELLIDRLNIPFDKTPDSGFDLTTEGGHGMPRVLHRADWTGRAIMEGLTAAVKSQPNINILVNRTAIDLLASQHHAKALEYKYHLTNQCVGAYVFNNDSKSVETIFADFTLLATGGIGQIYLHTTNSPASKGSALAMAYRAKVRIINSEFVQFHPTALFRRAEPRFLITEALRGEGAKLINSEGEAFMSRYDPRAELAPRDVVTKAIVDEMLRTGEHCVFLNAADYVENDLVKRFPTIYRECQKIGIDITKDSIPVVPAAHYFCGGVLVDPRGRTTLSRLYAAGECSCTGVHGANRLASTSLLEGLLWGYSVAEDISRRVKNKEAKVRQKLIESIPDWVSPGNEENEDPALIAQDWAAIRNTMWNYVGIARTKPRLNRAFEDIRHLNKRLHDFYRKTPISRPIIDLFHGCHAAYSVTVAALRNHHSVGCHYRVD